MSTYEIIRNRFLRFLFYLIFLFPKTSPKSNFNSKLFSFIVGLPDLPQEPMAHLERSGAAEARLADDQPRRRGVEGVALSGQGGRPQETNGRLEGHLLQGARIVLDADSGTNIQEMAP